MELWGVCEACVERVGVAVYCRHRYKTKTPDTAVNYILSQHAQEQLIKTERNIPFLVFEQVMVEPEQVVLDEYGGSVYQSRFVAENGKTYLLRAFINDTVEPMVVKSVYVTSKVRKYWSEQ